MNVFHPLFESVTSTSDPSLSRANFLKLAKGVTPQRYLLFAIPEEFRHQPHVYGTSGVHFLARFIGNYSLRGRASL